MATSKSGGADATDGSGAGDDRDDTAGVGQHDDPESARQPATSASLGEAPSNAPHLRPQRSSGAHQSPTDVRHPPPPAGFRAGLCALRTAQKPGSGVSLYSRWINRPLGRVGAAAAHRAGLGPHQVTAVSALFTYSAIAAIALAEPSLPLGVAVWAALATGFALDSADGQLARLQGVSGPVGEWLDHVVDCVKITGLHAAVLISLYRFGELPQEAWLLVPLAFQLAAVTTYCGGLLTEKLKPRPTVPPSSAAVPPPAVPSRLRAVALLPVDYGVVCAVFLLWGSPAAFLASYTVLAVAAVLMLGAFLVKWYRELEHSANGAVDLAGCATGDPAEGPGSGSAVSAPGPSGITPPAVH